MSKDLQKFDTLTLNQVEDKFKVKWLKQQTNQFSVVLNDSGADIFKNASYIVKTFNCCLEVKPLFIAFCKHDKDFDEVNQRLETPHYQGLIIFQDSMQFKSMIKLIQDLFKGCNENQIGLEKCNSIPKLARYVIHRGFYGKHPYELSELATNDMDLYMKYYNMVDIEDNNHCVMVVKLFNYSLEDIICHVSNYSKYRSVIKDLITEYRFRGRL